MEPLSSFAIGLAVNAVYDLIKTNINSSLKREMDSAFESSLSRWSTNDLIIDKKRSELKECLESSFHNGDEFYSNELPQEIKCFLILFNEELCLKQQAYNFLKEINDKKRYYDLKGSLESIEEKVDSLIAASSKENEEIKKILIDNTPLHQEWKDQIKIYQKLLEEFKPKTALSLVESLNERLVDNHLETNPILQSKVEYLRALCVEQIQEKRKDSYKSFIKAYELAPSNKTYKEKACVAFYLLQEFPSAETLAKEIISIDSLNLFANAIKVLLNLNEFKNEIELTPITIKKATDFNRILFLNLRNRKEMQELCSIYPKIIFKDEKLELLDSTYHNFKNNVYIVEIGIIRFLSHYKIELFDSELLNKSELEDILRLLEDFNTSIKDTEIQKDYWKIEFFSTYIRYILYRERTEVFKLKEIYDSLTKPIDDLMSVMMANVLQRNNQDEEALSILSQITEDNQISRNLILYCANKMNNVELIVESTNKINKSINSIDSPTLLDFLRIIRLLGFRKKLDSFDFDLLKSKSFDKPEFLKFVKIYHSLWLNDAKDEFLSQINEIKEVLFQENNTISTYLHEAYFKNKNYEESVSMFKFNDDQLDSQLDISYHIDALNIVNQNNQELLRWLEHWRTNFDFDSRFTRMEIGKMELISDWKKCETICEYALKHEEHEDFILYLLISLYHNDNKEKVASYIETITKHSYKKSKVAIQIVNFLFHFNYYKEGLDLCYLWAKEKDDKQARTFFFTSFMHIPFDDFFIELQEISEGSFVRYTRNDDLMVHTKEVGNDDFSTQLIGHAINDEIVVKRTYGKEEDIIKINRICNKYLALKLEIMDETHNPQSGLGMQSFTIKENDSIIDVLSEIVPPIDKPEKPYEQYYSQEIKFSQLPFFSAELKNNFIITYYKLLYEKKGILKVDPKLFPLFGMSNNYEFIVDFTSLLFLFDLSKEGKLNLTVKYNVSNFMLDIIKSYREDKFDYIQHKDYQINDKFYSELIEWIGINCKVVTPVQLLDIIGNKKINKREPFSLYMLNQVAMLQEIQNSVLITDDLFFYQTYPLNQKKLMSTDYYRLFDTLTNNFQYV